ncbi:hypothetical protein FGB62_91g020 [Gracilaria domingensis]|nr:hypothetical protein FGB62_91g020 [Gracilaria domingensis]
MIMFITPASFWMRSKAIVRVPISNRFENDSSGLDGCDYRYSALAKSCVSLPYKRLSISEYLRGRFAETISVGAVNHGYLHPPLARSCLVEGVDMPVESLRINSMETKLFPLHLPSGDARETSPLCERSQPSANWSTQADPNSPQLIETGSNFCLVGQAIRFIAMHQVTLHSRHSTFRREHTPPISLTHNAITEMSIKKTHTSGIVERANSGHSDHVDQYRCSIINVNSGGHIDSGQVTARTLTVNATREAEQPRNLRVMAEVGLEHCSPLQYQTLHNPAFHETVSPASVADFLRHCSVAKRAAWSMKSPNSSQEQNGDAKDEREQRYEERLVVSETDFEDFRYGTCHSCGSPIVIPGLAQFYCAKCGWIRRPVDMMSITPGHHD